MIQITDFQCYEECLTRIQASGIKLTTNCSFLPEDIRKYIAKGTLYCEERNELLLLINDLGRFYEIYYWGQLVSSAKLHSLPRDKPILLSHVYSRKQKQTADERNWWLERGFRVYKTAERMTKSLNAKPVQEGPIFFLQQIHLEWVEKEIAQWFDPLSDKIPTHGEMLRAVAESRLIGIQNRGGELTAFAHFERSGKTMTLTHIEVNAAFRGEGIGGRLLRQLFAIGVESGVNRIYAWVNQGNISSEQMHAREGFQFDGRISEKFILNMED